MFDRQKKIFFNGGGVQGLTEDALVVFLVSISKTRSKKSFLFLSKSDSLNKRVCGDSRWFGRGLIYYPEREARKTVPGFMSQYNRHRSSAIIKVATLDSVCCLSTVFASKNANINKKTKPIAYKINVGDVLNRDDFIKQVLALGYKKVDTVFMAGDMSSRGDIVDVFPIYEKEPVRVSFGFNNIDSVSFFNIDTQRTIKPVQNYSFWDVFGREVESGRSLLDFISWGAVAKITKEGGLYSVLQTSSGGLINSKTCLLQTKIESRVDFLSFLAKKPQSSFYLVCPDKNKIKPFTNKS